MKTGNIVHRRREDGMALLHVICFLFIILGLVITICDEASNHRQIAISELNMDQAVYVAEGGMEVGCRNIQSNILSMVVTLTTSTNFTGVINNGTYSYCINRVNSTTFSLVSTGAVNGCVRKVSVLNIYQPTYAEFALWSHVNGAITIGAGELFNGHVHADDALYFGTTSGTGATFNSWCDSATNYWVANGSNNGSLSGITFADGFQLNTYMGKMADVDFNSVTNTSMKNVAATNGLVLTGSATMTFNGATISIWNTAASWTNHTYTPNTTNGIIYVKNNGTNTGTLWLNGGNTSGRLTIVSENDMFISGNLTYTTNPQSNSASTCALGLITSDSITITTNAPNNLQIFAAMMCTGTSGDGDPGSFGVTNYASGSLRGNLTLYGGIVQNNRGAVGTGPGVTGYVKNYSYDPRFISNPPPYYPVISGLVRFAQWTEGPKQ